MTQLDREQVVTLMNVYEGKQPVFIDHPAFEEPLPVLGVSLKDGRIILYCDKKGSPSGSSKIISPNTNPTAIIFTDGACSGNPGPGGWAHITKIGADEWERSGGVNSETTNQRMEIAAAAHALQHLLRLKEDRYPRITSVVLYTDSKYVVETMSGRWQKGKNMDMWSRLMEAAKHFHVEWKHCKGGSDPTQERCDKMAKAATPK